MKAARKSTKGRTPRKLSRSVAPQLVKLLPGFTPFVFELNDRERMFAEAYVDISVVQGTNHGAIRAAMRRVSSLSYASADTLGYEMLAKPNVQRYIEHLRATLAERFVTNQERIIQEIHAIAFANVRDYLRLVDLPVGTEGITETSAVVDLAGLSDFQMAAIAEFKIEETFKPPGRKIILRFHDKSAALDKLCRIRGMYQDRNNLTISFEELQRALAHIKERLRGARHIESQGPILDERGPDGLRRVLEGSTTPTAGGADG